jgi:hypothetical protein
MHVRDFRRLPVMLAVLGLAGAPEAARGEGLFGNNVSGLVTVGATAGDGDTSWLRRGLGKLQAGDGTAPTLDAVIAWSPRLSQRAGAVVSVQAQSAGDDVVSVNEGYLTYRPDPAAAVRLSGRLGLFYPALSLEHDGREWSLVHTLTASAINSWVAEEVKVGGLEATVRSTIAGRPVSLTAAAFQGADTSGALLFYRGWALHDLRSGLNTKLPLPPASVLFAGTQAPDTRGVVEVDGRWGGYVRMEVTPTPSSSVSLFAFDNRGEPTAIERGQYAWRTRFAQASGRWTSRSGARILAQAMTGESAMGPPLEGVRPAFIGFDSAFVLYAMPVRASEVSFRADYFAISDWSFKSIDNNAERGLALTSTWNRRLAPRLHALMEGTVSGSHRPARVRQGEAPRQVEMQVRAALRFVL